MPITPDWSFVAIAGFVVAVAIAYIIKWRRESKREDQEDRQITSISEILKAVRSEIKDNCTKSSDHLNKESDSIHRELTKISEKLVQLDEKWTDKVSNLDEAYKNRV